MKRLNFVLCLVGLVLASAASAAPSYNIVPLGLNDPEHTASNGYLYSQAYKLNQAGKASGFSRRFNGLDSLGESAWLYDGATTITIGLIGAEQTRNDGYKSSYGGEVNESGQVSGASERFNGGSNNLGQSAWLYDGATTIEIGLTGAEHTSNDGSKRSDPYRLNEAGQVSGISPRFNGGSTDLGRSAWLYDGVTTINIGLTGAEHTRNDGYKSSLVSYPYLSEAGQVLGQSDRYNGGSSNLGNSVWLYDGAATSDVGLTGALHTRSDGYKLSYSNQLNDAGQVSGMSQRFSGTTDMGWSAWLYDGATTIDIGLVGSEHTRNDGYKASSDGLHFELQLNQAGQVGGWSQRFNGGSTDLGRSAWFYNGVTTINIGLTGTEHTASDGYKYSSIYVPLNQAGQVIGESYRYEGANHLGFTAWLYDGSTTIDIGLTGPQYSATNGYQVNGALELNEAGQVRGYSQRFSGNDDLGQTVWLYTGSTTTDIGLTGPDYTRSNGYRYSVSDPNFSIGNTLNEAGQIIGVATRYSSGDFELGQDAWLYDPVLDQTVALNLSTRSDGYAYSEAVYLGDDGLVLGWYQLFDSLDNSLGERAFYFTIADGLHDLGLLVDGGLAANGWEYLASTLRANDLGQILGHGKLASQPFGQMPYLLTPISIPGDFNHDQVVDAADYVTWRKTDGSPAGYEEWRTHFGQTAGSGAAGSLSHAVPEPCTSLLLAGCLPALVAARRVRLTPKGGAKNA